MGIIRIIYNEPDAKTYKSVEISFGKFSGKEETRTFDTGNFIQDWYDMRKFMIKEMEDEPYMSHSSSVDHFFMDGAQYDSAYLHIVDEKPVLKYFDRTDPDWLFTQRDIDENGWEFFVPEGAQPTWEELKEICK